MNNIIKSNQGKDILFKLLYGSKFGELMKEYNMSLADLSKLIQAEVIRRQVR